MSDITMNDGGSGEERRQVVATLVAERLRPQFLAFYFGRHFLSGEALVYTILGRLCADYDGGYWEYYALSNGGFYMAPAGEKRFRLSCPGNGFEGELSADAAGVVATLMALNALAWRTESGVFADLFYKLRDFALGHAKADAIMRAID